MSIEIVTYVYMDPSAAHERAMRENSRAVRVTIEPRAGRYIVTVYRRDEEI